MNTAQIPLASLNQFDKTQFVDTLKGIFEHSAWVAEQVYEQRPFASVASLHQAMADIVRKSSHEQQITLIKAHPELAGKTAVLTDLTAESRSEQTGAGLDRCSPAEFEQIQSLNAQYQQKFGFPFILAVKGHNRQSIIENIALRVNSSPEQEKSTALEQIYKIAGFRLEALIEG